MMSSKGPDAAGLRVPRRGKRKSGPMQYVMFGVVAVVVVIVVVVVLAAGRKPASTAGRLPKASRSSEVDGGRQTRRTTKPGAVRSSATERRARRERSRRERPSRRAERRGSATYSSRSSSGGYTSKRSGPPVVKAIGTDPSGSHYALVGERYVRNGDEVEGRRIVEVSGSGVKVQYATKTYTVGVNQPLY